MDMETALGRHIKRSSSPLHVLWGEMMDEHEEKTPGLLLTLLLSSLHFLCKRVKSCVMHIFDHAPPPQAAVLVLVVVLLIFNFVVYPQIPK